MGVGETEPLTETTMFVTILFLAVVAAVCKAAVKVAADAEKANEPKPAGKKYSRYKW